MMRFVRRIAPFLLAVTLFGGRPGSPARPVSAPPGRAPRPPLHPARAAVPSGRSRAILALQIGHTSQINRVAFSPDGKTLATGSTDATARLRDVASGQVKAALQGHTGTIQAVAFSPDGRRLATGSADATARLWNVATGQLETTLRGHMRHVSTLAFSPDGKTLATGSDDSTARLWEVSTGRLKTTLRGHAHDVTALAFSPDGRRLATGSHDPSVRLWEVASGRLITTLPVHTGLVDTVAFAPDGKTLAVGGWAKAELWDTATRHSRATLEGRMLVISPDGKTLALGSSDQTARLWDVSTGRVKAALQGKTGSLRAIAFAPDGKTLAAGSLEGTARLWEVSTGQLKATLEGHRGPVETLAFAPDGKTLATGSWDSSSRLWDVATGRLRRALQGSLGGVWKSAFSPDAGTLASGAEDDRIQLWDTAKGELKAILPGHEDHIWALAFSPDGKMLATGSFDKTVRLWDVAHAQLRAILRGQNGYVETLAFSPDGQTLATAGSDQGVGLWDVATGQLKATLEGHKRAVETLTFSPDGRTLATGSSDNTVRLWEVANGRLKAVLQEPSASVREPVFSPDGKTLASGSFDGAIRLWDAATGRLQTTLRGPTGSVWRLAFSPEGKTLASAGEDWTLRLWDVASGRLNASLRGHEAPIEKLAFSADGRTLASRDYERIVLLWDVFTGRRIPLPAEGGLSGFPPEIARPVSNEGPALALHDPRDGRIRATLMVIPPGTAQRRGRTPERRGQRLIVRDSMGRIVAILSGAAPAESTGGSSGTDAAAMRPTVPGANAAPPSTGDEWFVATPEGYFHGSANAARSILWNVGGTLHPAERYLKRFRRPDLVRKALRGEKITAPALSAGDLPPTARFIGLKNGDAAPGSPLSVTVEARGVRPMREAEILVNGRPLADEQARPITAISKPITAGSRGAVSPYRNARSFTYRVSLPAGAAEIHLRATAYDVADLGSDPVEIVLRRPGAAPVAGNLYVLAVGVSRYRHAARQGFPNLRFPADDARAVAERFRREGRPLYERVEVRLLTDEGATAARVGAEIRRLQSVVRSGQIDTVVIFLSGHGISGPNGSYSFATHDTDLRNLPASTLSGRALREGLGARLRARAVFLFVDTCHSGGLNSRNDDLALQVASGGVYVLTSSGATQSSYESPEWGHGAFTQALLRALDKADADGVVRFNGLTYQVPNEVATLLMAAGRSETEQQPRYRAEGPPRMPIARASR